MKRKLQLHRETVRTLTGQDLTGAQGGATITLGAGCPRLTATCFNCPPVTLQYTVCESYKPTCPCQTFG